MAIINENKKFCWFKGHEIDNFTSINADIIKVIDIVGCEGWELVGSIQAIPICCHMNLYSPTLTPNFDLPWPLRPLCDLLDIFFQLQNIQLNRFINGTPWYMAKTCATGFQNLGCYAAKTTFYFIEEPIVHRLPEYWYWYRIRNRGHQNIDIGLETRKMNIAQVCQIMTVDDRGRRGG